MDVQFKRWLRIPLLNLWIVSSIGVILRYKILFSLPFVDQKYLLHGHSHFAFAGWVSQAIMVLMVHYLSGQGQKQAWASYKFLLIANLVSAYGMLVTFPIQGYGAFSIAFSTLSVLVSYAFSVRYWKDLNKLPVKEISHRWFKASLFFNIISSLGTFGLAYMMANKIIHQNWYLAAIYYYLHFQYNGWFFFACMGLLFGMLRDFAIPESILLKVYRLFAFACIPAYFLSALWMEIPVWVYVLVVIASFLQVIAWFILVRQLFTMAASLNQALKPVSKWLMSLSALALTVKLLLQLGSTIPSLSQLAFGFRPIVVAYLHLVLLGVISLFLIGYSLSLGVFRLRKLLYSGIWIFTTGVILNEVVLMLQGVAGFSYDSIPCSNEMLFGITLMMFSGLFLMVVSVFSGEAKP